MTEPTPRTFRRADILDLARSGKPWEFLPLAARALARAPGDHEMRFHASAQLARLGLREPALEQLDILPTTGDVESLRSAIAGLPSAVLSTESRIELVRRGAALAINLGASVDVLGWESSAPRFEWFQARDGNVIRRPRAERDMLTWFPLRDARAEAKHLAERFAKEMGEDARPWIIEGVDPPWIALEVARALKRTGLGYTPRLTIVQCAEAEFLDGCALADIAPALERDSAEVFIGPDASRRLGKALQARRDGQIVGPVYSQARAGTRPAVQDVLRSAAEGQRARVDELQVLVREAYAGRDAAWWSARFEAGLRRAGAEPLRVLIPTCRYSTFIRHASEDLASALERRGLRARVLMERDDATRFASGAYLEAFHAFRPDLVVLINYPRASLDPGIVPGEVPMVCWVQDAMGHLFDPKVARAQGPLDFVVGHLHVEMFKSLGYPPDRARALPVPADEEKFCEEPGDPAPADVCDMLCVTHHSETPDAMHDRLAAGFRGAGIDARVSRLVETLRPKLGPLALRAHTDNHHTALRRTIVETAREALGAEPSAKMVESLLRQYALPLFDRVFRHQALHWASRLAQRRGWSLRLAGRGWSEHPTLGAFAVPAVEHGPSLRRAYRGARVNLHLCATSLTHQRVLECALSGGFTACRFFRDALGQMNLRAQSASLHAGPPRGVIDGMLDFDPAMTPEGMLYMAQSQRLGLTDRPWVRVKPSRREGIEHFGALTPAWLDAHTLLGDLAAVTFWDEPSLEALMERAIERPAWRENVRAGVARRVRSGFTTDACAGAMLDLVAECLAREARRRPASEAAA
ncbi:MAG: hypothetical protein IT439_09750 [Phycisphaerales bacterium]|nr:hypothetical protein [Phycisphaerales bacterium]